MIMDKAFDVLVIGGGTGGIMTSSQILKKDPSLKVGVIEPGDTHYYQPAWTLVGAGTYDMEKTAKPMKEVMPDKVTWIKDKAVGFKPEENKVKTAENGDLEYKYLIVSPGLVMALDKIEGLPEAMEKGVVCSNYTDPEHVWETLKNFKGGNVIFTQPTTPIKCGGAPQKIAYLSADYIRNRNNDKESNILFATPGTVIFGVTEVAETLHKVLDRYDMDLKTYHAPVKIDPENKKVYYQYIGEEEAVPGVEEGNKYGAKLTDNNLIEIPFEMLHLAPPQKAPDFVENSDLVNEEGWLDVDHHSLQHNKYSNIFGVGDVCGLPTAKTGAAIRKQAPIVIDNIFKLMAEKEADNASYNGYSSCPLITGYGKMVLAEFDYDNNFTPDPKLKQMLVFDSSKEHYRLWLLKKYVLPYLYWNKMMKGKQV